MSWSDDFVAANLPQQQSAPAQPAAVPPALAAPKVAAAQPQQGWTAPGSSLMGIGDVVRGGAQDIVHGLSWAADKIAPDSQFAKDARAALPQIQSTIDQQNATYANQRTADGSNGFDFGRLTGNVVGTAPTILMGGGGPSLIGKVGMGALQGATGAALMPTSGADGSFADQKLKQMGVGAATVGAIPLVAGAARAAGNGLWNVVQPVMQPERYVGRGIAGAMNPADAAQAAANIRSAPTFVPGSVPTTAQAAQTPFMVQTEKAAGNLPAVKTAMMQRAIDNNDARWSALMGVAQTPEALAAAQTARSDAVEPLYAQAADQTANIGKAFMKLAQRPAMQQAMQQADQLAANRGESLVWPQQGGSMAISGRALDYTKQALDDMIGNAQASNQGSLAAGLQDARSQLINWTQRYIPAQRQASQTFAQMSPPINTMQVGQEIANGLGTRAMNAGGAPEIGLMPFRSALTKAMNSGDAAKYGIDANALGTLQGIGQDLQRATVSNSVKQGGSDTAYNLAANGWLARNLYGPTFGGATPVGRIIAGGATALAGHPFAGAAVASGIGKAGQMVGNRLQNRLSGLLMDPETVLPYLDARAASAQQAVPGALMQGLLNYGRPAATTGLISGFQNSGNK